MVPGGRVSVAKDKCDKELCFAVMFVTVLLFLSACCMWVVHLMLSQPAGFVSFELFLAYILYL